MSYISATTEIMYAPLPLRLVIKLLAASNLAPQLLPRVLRMQLLQLVPQLLGLHVLNFRDDNADLDDLVADDAGAGCRGHALLAHAQLLPGLRAGRNAQHGPAVNGGHLDLGALRGLPREDRQGNVDVVGLAFEDRMLGDPHDDVEIARRRASGSGISFAGEPYALAFAGSRFDAEGDRLGRHAPAWRGPLNVELHLAAADRLPEGHLHGVFDVAAGGAHRLLRHSAAGEYVGEDVAEAAAATALCAAEIEVAEVELHALAGAWAVTAEGGASGWAAALGIGIS